MTGISRRPWGRASWLCLVAAACGGRAVKSGDGSTTPAGERFIPMAQAIILETAGPPPSDTSVSFVAGEPRTIILRHGAPDNIVFAELVFPPGAFADSGREVQVDVRPRPGIYGVDIKSSLPIGAGASLTFKYARYFAAPARARDRYGNDVLFERALAIGQAQPGGTLRLLPTTRPASDNLQAPLPGSGTYLVAAP
ncbi:MAG: hypothetical protein ACREMX_02235 [Gemmatimonadales bacterium]